MFKDFRAYNDGFLPENKSLSEHTATYVQVIEELGLAKAVLDQEDMEEASKNSSPNDGEWTSITDR